MRNKCGEQPTSSSEVLQPLEEGEILRLDVGGHHPERVGHEWGNDGENFRWRCLKCNAADIRRMIPPSPFVRVATQDPNVSRSCEEEQVYMVMRE